MHTNAEKLKYLVMHGFKKLSLKQRALLYIMSKKYLKNKEMYGTKSAILSFKQIGESKNFKYYSCLLAQYSSDEIGNGCIEKNPIIVTDLTGNILLRIDGKKYEAIKNPAKIDTKDFIFFDFESYKLLPIENAEILSFIAHSKNLEFTK